MPTVRTVTGRVLLAVLVLYDSLLVTAVSMINRVLVRCLSGSRVPCHRASSPARLSGSAAIGTLAA
jgi:hypothetical protein